MVLPLGRRLYMDSGCTQRAAHGLEARRTELCPQTSPSQEDPPWPHNLKWNSAQYPGHSWPLFFVFIKVLSIHWNTACLIYCLFPLLDYKFQKGRDFLLPFFLIEKHRKHIRNTHLSFAQRLDLTTFNIRLYLLHVSGASIFQSKQRSSWYFLFKHLRVEDAFSFSHGLLLTAWNLVGLQ